MRSELALPAGSLQCALWAFKGGADAVYLGTKQFSARKNAVNFSFEDLRKLKQYCIKNNKKFYITVNTLLKNEEIPQLLDLLKELSFIKPNALIIQDLGIANIIKTYFPDLEMHASTQLAVHTVNGVKQLVQAGFTRAVLSRELTFDEIKKIREQCPEIELKVFIHGALCYGFSGLCFASEILTGRSANRGECAQICRTWFTDEETGRNAYFCSMKDLCMGEKIKELQDIGIDSFKIEGRMKDSEYCYYTAKYYSMILDGADKEEIKKTKDSALVSFARSTTTGYEENDLTDILYPGHRGIEAGTAVKAMHNRLTVKFSRPLSIRDGLFFYYAGQHAGFALKNTDNGKSFVSAGETCTIDFPSSAFSKTIPNGTKIFCTSFHNMLLPAENENLPLYKCPVSLNIILKKDSIEINGKTFKQDLQKANKKQDIQKIFTQIFMASDQSLFTAESIKINNQSGFEDVFIPLSSLKEIRRNFYAELDNEFFNKKINIQSPVLPTFEQLPDRKQLGLWGKETVINGYIYLPLSPVMFNEQEYFNNLEKATAGKKNLRIGINNIAQFKWAQSHPEFEYFADFYLYAANDFAKKEILNHINAIGFTNTSQDGFTPPLFISRVNPQCRKMSQNAKTFNVIEQDGCYILQKSL